MKNFLCINTCFSNAEVFVETDRTFFKRIDANCKHSEHVLPEIEKLLLQAGLRANDVDVLGVCVGPGSFTGIRIGVSLAKGMGFVRNLPCIAFSSFEIIAQEFFLQNPSFDEVVVVLDGLSGYVFVAKLAKSGEYLVEPTCLDQSGMAEFVKSNKCEYVCHEDDRSKFALHYISTTSKAYESLLRRKFDSQRTTSCLEIAPLYLRKSQAEVELEKKNANN